MPTSTAAKCRWTGSSGSGYDYQVYPLGTRFKKEVGNYIYCREVAAGRWAPQYIGQTTCLDERLGDHEKEACARRNGATHIHAHLNPVQIDRFAEEEDLIRAYRPPCNTQHVG